MHVHNRTVINKSTMAGVVILLKSADCRLGRRIWRRSKRSGGWVNARNLQRPARRRLQTAVAHGRPLRGKGINTTQARRGCSNQPTRTYESGRVGSATVLHIISHNVWMRPGTASGRCPTVYYYRCTKSRFNLITKQCPTKLHGACSLGLALFRPTTTLENAYSPISFSKHWSRSQKTRISRI